MLIPPRCFAKQLSSYKPGRIVLAFLLDLVVRTKYRYETISSKSHSDRNSPNKSRQKTFRDKPGGEEPWVVTLYDHQTQRKCIANGESLKLTIQLHCLVSPMWIISRPPISPVSKVFRYQFFLWENYFMPPSCCWIPKILCSQKTTSHLLNDVWQLPLEVILPFWNASDQHKRHIFRRLWNLCLWNFLYASITFSMHCIRHKNYIPSHATSLTPFFTQGRIDGVQSFWDVSYSTPFQNAGQKTEKGTTPTKTRQNSWSGMDQNPLP